MAAGLIGLACLASAPAGASAQGAGGPRLLGTMPAADGEVDRPPEVARAVFGSEVEAVDEGVEVRDRDGRRVDDGPVEPPPSPAVVEATLPPDLPAGRYEATWRVRSADGATAEGSWSFVVVDDPEVEDAAGGRVAWILLALVLLALSGGVVWRVLTRRG